MSSARSLAETNVGDLTRGTRDDMTSASLRAARAGAAVVDNVLQRYLRPGVANLGVGLAHWRVPNALAPPVVAADSAYGPTTGHAPLVDTLRQRLAADGVD